MVVIIIFIILLSCVGVLCAALKGNEVSSTNKSKQYPVSKEQKAIFKQNWLLEDFRKKFGKKLRIENCVNGTTFKSYKCCRIGCKGKIWISFSSSLGELSVVEILKRERELMIGLSDKGNYVLYDNKITPWENVNID